MFSIVNKCRQYEYLFKKKRNISPVWVYMCRYQKARPKECNRIVASRNVLQHCTRWFSMKIRLGCMQMYEPNEKKKLYKQSCEERDKYGWQNGMTKISWRKNSTTFQIMCHLCGGGGKMLLPLPWVDAYKYIKLVNQTKSRHGKKSSEAKRMGKKDERNIESEYASSKNCVYHCVW